jgi:hypothetical protein
VASYAEEQQWPKVANISESGALPPRAANRVQQCPSERPSQCESLQHHRCTGCRPLFLGRHHTNSCLLRYAFSFFPIKNLRNPLNQNFSLPRLRSTLSRNSLRRGGGNTHLTWTPSSTDSRGTGPDSCTRPRVRGWWADTGAQDASFRPFRKDAVLDRCRARAAAPSGCSCGWCKGLGTWLLGCPPFLMRSKLKSLVSSCSRGGVVFGVGNCAVAGTCQSSYRYRANRPCRGPMGRRRM